MTEALSLAIILALGLAIRFYFLARRSDRRADHLDKMSAARLRCINRQAETIEELRTKLATSEAKRNDLWKRYLDKLDEIAAMKAESDRGPEAA